MKLGAKSRLRMSASVMVILLVSCGGRQGVELDATQARASTTPYLSGVSEFHWATAQSLDRVAMNFRFQLPESSTTCTLKTAKCVRWNGLGLSSWQVTTANRSTSWGGWSPVRGGDYIVAGPIDTRFELEVDEQVCELTSITHDLYSGVLDHYSFGADVEPRTFENGHTLSMAVSLQCDASFDVLGAEIGSEATLYNWDTLDVVAVNQDPVGNLMIGSASELLESENSGYFTGHSGEIEGAAVYVEAPDGPHVSAPFDLVSVSSERLEHVAAGPGAYDITVTRANAVGMGSWWLLTYGLERPFDLGPGLLTESAFEITFPDEH